MDPVSMMATKLRKRLVGRLTGMAGSRGWRGWSWR
jgi:hypothetical protein